MSALEDSTMILQTALRALIDRGYIETEEIITDMDEYMSFTLYQGGKVKIGKVLCDADGLITSSCDDAIKEKKNNAYVALDDMLNYMLTLKQ